MRLAARLLPLILLAACQGTGMEGVQLSPEHEFRPERLRGTREPVILIPGTLGSRLYNIDTGEIAWGNFAATVSELTDDLALPIHRSRLANNLDRLRAYRVLDRAEIIEPEGSGEVRFYAEIIDHLASSLSYRPAYGRRFYRGHDLFVFFYDWRRSNVEAATQLAEFIATIRRDLNAPDMKFTFVAVSNGGLVARYYLRYGGADVISDRDDPLPAPTFAGVRDCARLICLGTPHNGAVDALNLLHEGYAPNLLARRYPPETIFSFPAAFELMPEPGEKTFVGSGGESLDIDLWAPETWETCGISVFQQSERDRLRNDIALVARPGDDREIMFEQALNERRAFLRLALSHARRFRQAIEGPPEVPTDVILGSNTATLARVGLVQEDGDWKLHFRPRVPWGRYDPMAEAMYALGDGIVTRRSALGLAIPESTPEVAERGRNFNRSLAAAHLTPMAHRTMFEDAILRVSLIQALSEPP